MLHMQPQVCCAKRKVGLSSLQAVFDRKLSHCLKMGYALDNGYIEVEHTLEPHQLSGSILFTAYRLDEHLHFEAPSLVVVRCDRCDLAKCSQTTMWKRGRGEAKMLEYE